MYRMIYKLFGITSREIVLGSLTLVAAIAAGWLSVVFTPIESYLRGGGVLSIPFFLLSGLVVQIRLKHLDLTSHDGLNRREARRLATIIGERDRRLNVLIAFYVLSGIFIALAPMFAAATSGADTSAAVICAALVAIVVASLSALGFSLWGWLEVDQFKMRLDMRVRDRRERDRLLDKLTGNHV